MPGYYTMRLRDGIAIVHAAWMCWAQVAKPRLERSARLHEAADAVTMALEALDRAVREDAE